MTKKLVGKITHFFNKISVAVLSLTDEIKVGDKISIEGKEGAVEQVVESMQVEHKEIGSAKAGDDVGMKTVQPVKVGDDVYKVEEE